MTLLDQLIHLEILMLQLLLKDKDEQVLKEDLSSLPAITGDFFLQDAAVEVLKLRLHRAEKAALEIKTRGGK